jgi:Zn-dependent M16 (insulinase) family peptidase
MIDLIILRKIVESGLRFRANAGNSHPTITPTTIAIIIHDVSEMRLRFRKIMPMRL